MAFIVEAASLPLDRFNKDRKDGKNTTFEKYFEVVLTAWPTSLRVNCISCVLSLNFEKKIRMADGYVIELKQEEKDSRPPLSHRKTFHKTSQKLHWNDADQNDSFSNYFYLFPYSASLKIK